jgi:RimJ/RimL family protein N-acetyltransferase
LTTPAAAVFETERLRAVPWRDEHAEPAYAAYSDPDFTRYLGSARTHESVDDTRSWIGRIRTMYDDGRAGFWALERRVDGAAVGATICQPLPGGAGEYEIGWHVFPVHQRNGYAVESGRGAASYGFETLGLDAVFATVAPANAASLAVARRIGMTWVERTTRYYDGFEAELFRLTPRDLS